MRVLALVLLLSLFLPLSQAQAACGKFVVVKGNVQVDFAKEKRSDKAHVGTEVCAGDSISAGADSRAKIKMVDNNELNISPDTVMKIATYEYKPEENQKKVLLDVLKGKVRSTVKQKYDGQASTYQVKTKAAVAGVRGTDFIASFDPKVGRLQIVTFEGRVEVGAMGKDGRVMPDVAVTAGQMTEVNMGKTAEPPRAVPAAELKQMDSNSQASIPSPKARDQASNDSSGKKGEDKKDDKRKGDQAKGPVEDERHPASIVKEPQMFDSNNDCAMCVGTGPTPPPGPPPAPPTPPPSFQPPVIPTPFSPQGSTNLNVIINY